MSLQGKVALVTGAGRGLGREFALAFARQGCNVVINYVEHEGEAREVARQVDALGAKALVAEADVADMRQVDAMVTEALGAFGRLDILVNNAGQNRDGMVWKLKEDDWSRVLDVNLTGMFHCIKAVLPPMRQRRWGRIVNIASVVGQTGMAGTAAYAASKAGVIGLTKTVAREVARSNVTANALCLGYFEAGLGLMLPEDVRKDVTARIPVARFGRADEIAAPLLFLASEEASYITGQEINVNGGLHM